MQLSDHFSLAEMTRTSVRGLLNAPGEIEVARLRALCLNVLEPVRERFGPVVVHSGFRAPAVNAAVRGAAKSQHVRGEAADFHVIGVDFFTVARFITTVLDFDQLILEFCDPSGFGGGWIHCSYKSTGNRELITTASSGPGGTKYRNITADKIPVAA